MKEMAGFLLGREKKKGEKRKRFALARVKGGIDRDVCRRSSTSSEARTALLSTRGEWRNVTKIDGKPSSRATPKAAILWLLLQDQRRRKRSKLLGCASEEGTRRSLTEELVESATSTALRHGPIGKKEREKEKELVESAEQGEKERRKGDRNRNRPAAAIGGAPQDPSKGRKMGRGENPSLTPRGEGGTKFH